MSELSDNRKIVISLCKEVKAEFPDKDIWLWTGYTLEEVKADSSMREILEYVDVLVDGPFVQELKSPSLVYMGSSN